MAQIKFLKSIFLVSFLMISLAAMSQKTVRIFKLDSPIIIDGIHEPEKWQGAEIASDLVQTQPQSGKPASFPSEFYVGYDDQNIYLSAVLYQTSELVSSIQNRDEFTESDDCIVLILDSYNDRRSGYGFYLNPLGTQADFRINDDGRNIDVNWDTEWKSATGISEDRWTAEIQIPFSSIQYEKKNGEWGINFGRIIRSNFEKDWWSGEMSEDFRISQGGKLTGVEAPSHKSKLTLFPYVTGQFENDEVNGVKNKLSPDLGTDIKWQINPNLTFDGAINPDFATVEADQEQVNLTRYELSYPEKRLFFQEGNEMYDTRIKTFYSRRIKDIFYGAKVNGKTGKYNFNAMNVRTLQPSADDEPPSFFTTARLKRDFLESSSLGFTAVDKRNDSASVSVFSGDYMLNFGKNWKLTGQLVASLPGNFGSHSAWFVRFANESSIHHVHFRYTTLGENFMENFNQSGFIADDNRREMDADFSYKWWTESSFFRYIHFSSANNIFWSRTGGELRSWYLTEGIRVHLQNPLSFEYFYNNEYKLYEMEYFNHKHILFLGYNAEEWSHAELQYSRGMNYDRDFQRLEVTGQVKLTDKMAVGYEGDIVRFTPDTTNSSTFINVLKCNYNFTRDLWVQVFAQNRSNTGKFYLYGKMGWRFKPPFGALYVIYTHNQEMVLDERMDADVFFVKLTLPIGVLK